MSRILFNTLNDQPNKQYALTQAQLLEEWTACRAIAWSKLNPQLHQVAALAVMNREIGEYVIGRQNYEPFLGLMRAARVTMVGIGVRNQNHAQIVQSIINKYGQI